MTTLAIKRKLESHLQEKLSNHSWILNCCEGNFSSFPYRPNEDTLGLIAARPFRPQNEMTFLPTIKQDAKPLYIINIPIAHLPGQNSYQDLQKLVLLFKKESFGENEDQSLQAVNQQFSFVLGINQIQSLDPAKNRTFVKYMQRFPKIDDIACRVFGFFWKPSWKKTEQAKANTYPCKKAFLLLKHLFPKQAEKIRRIYESNESLNPAIRAQIPFQRIREKIKNSVDTSSLVEHFHKHTALSPIYFGVMDADCISLRTKEGLFSRFEKIISCSMPSVVSLGYSIADDENPLIQLGVRIDMKVREAIITVFPYGAYFPEPGSLFCIRKPRQTTHLLKSLTFIGPGNLENRRLIQNGLSKKIFGQITCFIADGGVITGTPSRMKTQKNEQVKKLSPEIIKQKRYLQSLRHISQSHATPKQWADELYIGLYIKGFKFKYHQVTDVTTPMMHIFNVFDPISRMFAYIGRYSKKVFNEIIDDYNNPLSEANKNLLATARAKLYELNMPKELIDRIEEAARRSGRAIFNELNAYR
jgi:hypothetical protein